MKLNTSILNRKFKGLFHKPFYLLFAILILCSHDLYIKMETYFLQPDQQATLSLYNGTFEKSENIITRDRMLDASFVAQGKRVTIEPGQWKDKDSTITQLAFNTGNAGTYVAGVSTRARNIELTADKFNDYLKHDGVLDMLEQRTTKGLLNQDAVESYQKHVKAIYQVGAVKTKDWSTILGYPIEFVPQANPYEKYSGDSLAVKLLLDGKPLANQLVYANYLKKGHTHTKNGHSHKHEGKKHSHKHKHGDTITHSHKQEGKKHSHKHKHGDTITHSHKHEGKKHSHRHKHGDTITHSHKHEGKKHSHKHKHGDGKHSHDNKSQTEETHTHTSGQQLRTNDQGIVLVKLPEDGIYYLRTIYMIEVTDSDELTHESKWATLTFEVTHQHGAGTHTHDHEHDEEAGIPTWIFVLGSVLIIAILFFVFRKKN